MKPKTMVLAVVAVVCGLVASYLTNQLLAQKNQQAPEEPTVKVVVAKARIGAYTPIKDLDKNFAVVEYPERIAPKKAIRDLEKLKDQRLNKIIDVDKPITEDDLMSNSLIGLSGVLKPGERAIAIRVNAESLAGGFILPGCRVDVVCTSSQGTTTNSKFILENMLILAVDTTDTRSKDQATIIGSTVTLAAKPEEATRLSLASKVGELRLTLRGVNDFTHVGPTPTSPDDLNRPLAGSEGPERPDAGRDLRAAPPVPSLPSVLPPEEPRLEAPPPPMTEAPKEKKVRTHLMTIQNGPTFTKSTIVVEGDDEPAEGAPSRSDAGSKPEARPAPPAAPATPAAPAAPAAPPSPFKNRYNNRTL